MSTSLGYLRKTGSRDVDISIVRYYGGTRKGICVQLTAPMQEEGRGYGYIQLSGDDIKVLLPILENFIVEGKDSKINCDKRFIYDDEIIDIFEYQKESLNEALNGYIDWFEGI